MEDGSYNVEVIVDDGRGADTKKSVKVSVQQGVTPEPWPSTPSTLPWGSGGSASCSGPGAPSGLLAFLGYLIVKRCGKK